jgi:glycerophosphoryl diester phosphodiesterase
MRLGASVEVDLVVHGSVGFAVLHDHEAIDRETTGHGSARSLTGDEMRALRLRDNDGRPTDEPVLLLEDLCALLSTTAPVPEAMLQLDYKENQGPLDDKTVAAFSSAVTPVARSMILSSGEAEAVTRLSEATPGLRVGHDPCHQGALERLAASRDFAGFVATAIADSPRAEMIYLAYPMILAASGVGFDIVQAFHDGGRRVDAYTIKAANAETRPQVEQLLALKVDQITTDDPEGLAKMLDAA